MTAREKFRKLMLEDILKFDLAELDFGIYRILNYRRAAIETFLTTELPKRIEKALGTHGQSRLEQVRRDLNDLREKLNQSAQSLGLTDAFKNGELIETFRDLPNGKRYLDLVDELEHLQAEAGFTESEENRMYDVLFNFFARYYSNGDFMAQMRRSRKATFSAPYHGEDVHFHWKSRGSHYVKTGEELKTYQYVDTAGWRVKFHLVEADTEKDNNKGKIRYFFPLSDRATADDQQRIFVIPFAFRPLAKEEEKNFGNKNSETQDAIVADAQRNLSVPSDLSEAKLAYHIRRYVRKNRTDYFVHARLGAFLCDELDYYLKNEFLLKEALTTPEKLSTTLIKFNALGEIGQEIIALLDQVEGFQARLFEKRKFVTQASYLIPARFLPHDLWSQVITNERQIAAWRDLFSLTGDITEETLASHPTLVIDTMYFDEAFTFKALANYDDIDGATDGILIRAENYAALRTLEHRLKNKVKCIYIDPPYNTGNDDFLYMDEFARHSTWLTMMEERLRAARELLDDDGVIFVSIDEHEQADLRILLDTVFGSENAVGTIIWKSSTDNNPTRVAIEHEYVLTYAKSGAALPTAWSSKVSDVRDLMLEEYARIKSEGGSILEIQQGFRRFVRDNASILEPLTHYTRVDEDGPYTGAREVHNPGKDGYMYDIPHPKTGKPCRRPARGYRYPWETMKKLIDEDRIIYGETEDQIVQIKVYLKDYTDALKSVIDIDSRVGPNALARLFKNGDVFRNPKPVELLERLLSFIGENSGEFLDFFAGSGTTAHAVINLNRTDGKNRKFILVEMNGYFDDVLVSRVQKVMYCPTWSDGKPTYPNRPLDDSMWPEWIKRSPQLVKVLRLESYEDSLNGLELPEEYERRVAGQPGLDLFPNELRYLFNVMMPEESAVLLNTQTLEHPFDYALQVHTPEGIQVLAVNLIETANLMLGLHVRRMHELRDSERRYVIIEAREKDDEVLVIWRDIDGLDPERERRFLREQGIDTTDYAAIYTNADSTVSKGGKVLDVEFKRRMLERDPGAMQQ